MGNMTIKIKLGRIKKIKEEMAKIYYNRRNDPKILKKQKELKEIQTKIARDTEPQLSALNIEMINLNNEIDAAKKVKAIELSEKVKAFIDRINKGCDWGPKGFTVRWVSTNERFVISTNGGHRSFSGRGETEYYPSSHYLFDLEKYKGEDRGYEFFQNSVLFECEGRLSKEKMKEWQDYAKGVQSS